MEGKTFLYLQVLGALIDDIVGIPRNICRHGEHMWSSCERIFVWNPDFGDYVSLFNVKFTKNRISNPRSLEGETIRVIADNMLPYVTSSNDSQVLGGFLGDIWQLMEETYGFTSNVSSIFYDTGLEIITSGRADVMLAAVVVKKGLLNVEYSQPYFYNWYQMYIRSPEAKASSASYLKTFDAQLWFVTLIIFAILTMSVWITIKFLNSVARMEPRISLPSCFLGITSGFINQGFDLKLSSYSGRMQVMFALLLGVVLYSAMNAVLVAQLAVFDIPFPFTSLDDVANKRTHSLCVRTNSFVHNNFTNEDKEPLARWKGIVNGPNCLNINNQTNLADILCKDNLVILENRVVMETIHKNYDLPCETITSPKKLFQTGNSFLLLRSFEYRRLINAMLKKMKSTGILQRLEDKWVRRDKLVNINMSPAPQVTLDHIKGVMVFYAVTIVISVLILSGEILYFRYMSADRPSSPVVFYYTK